MDGLISLFFMVAVMILDDFLKLCGIRKEPVLVVSERFGIYAWMLENKIVKVFGHSKVECYVLFVDALIGEGLLFLSLAT
jgi:hypothetical protein